MKLTVLGTGNANVTECYNTCFTLEEAGEILLVDGGGGSLLFQRLKAAGIDWRRIRQIYITHKHVDHLMGVLWMVRMITQGMARGSYDGSAEILGHADVIDLVRNMSMMLYPEKQTKYLDDRLKLTPVADGETRELLGHEFTFFDIGSTKEKQFGFSIAGEGAPLLCCCGDEPYNPREEPYASGARWLMHEAFCLYGQRDVFHPYEKHHSTALDAAKLARDLGVKNLILYHTEDKNYPNRKELYTREAGEAFSGCVFVPWDLETFEL